ncbi:MFS transporter [Tsuneonella sp. YG55]|uniref:MFS transporter n=1 Tax=Tsuneonella litorea TaxID=2976475 RepID=A0A9X2W3Z9_9SPHN|nr:MFS transporter [Tsuneonella litorea]MCT2559600.1 MFS transporter [Tsuneonella litorea]
MQTSGPSPRHRQSPRFLALYALAVGGGSASYAPFLTLFLPARLLELFGDRAVEVMSYSAFAGAIAASLSNIAFGWASDRTGHRRGWILAGLVLSSLLLVSMQWVETIFHLLAMVVAWQVSLNMMLAPLAAWAGDCVPDEQKGLLGGLLSLAPGMGALVGAAITLPLVAGDGARLVVNAALVVAMVLPVLVAGKPRPMPHLRQTAESGAPQALDAPAPDPASIPVWRMWLARLLVQISEASLFAFLLLWLRGLDEGVRENDVARVFAFVLFAAVPVAVLAGRWSDRARRPMAPLVVSVAIASLGLAGMSVAPNGTWGIGGYVTFGIAASVFLALHSSQTLRVLPRPEHRGRDLGVFNLTNTIPSLVMPGIALALIPVFGFHALFAVLAGLTFLAIPLLSTRRAVRNLA